MSKVIARFDDMAAARDAALALEGKGIDAGRVNLHGDERAAPRPEDASLGDMEVTGDVAKRFASGGILGAIAGATIVTVVVMLLGMEGPAIVAALIAGGLFGFNAGAFWNGARKLPVNEEALDATTGSGATEVALEVTVDSDEQASEVRQVLHQHRGLVA
jgi:hypothetical protein